MIRHFRGSRAIGFWCHFMFGLERNQQAEDETERATSTLRCLKDRFTGAGTGQTMRIHYHRPSGLLVPVDADFMPDTGDPQGDF
jgi:twinkle protein